MTPEGETEKEVLKVYLSCDDKKLYWGSDLMDYESQLNYAPVLFLSNFHLNSFSSIKRTRLSVLSLL